MKKATFLSIFYLTLILPFVVFAQTDKDTIVTLRQCVEFALRNQPAVRQAAIDEQINERNIKIGLADWLPQITSADLYQHYFQGESAAAAADPAALASGVNLNEFSTLN